MVMARLFLILLPLLIALMPEHVGAQPAVRREAQATTTPSLQLFRIGYLRRETTGHPDVEGLEGLRTYLWTQDRLGQRLRAAGYSGVGLFPCDGAADMERRLNAREFDIAFAPAVVYARQQSGYTAVLRSRRPDDIYAPGGQVWRRGVVIVSPRSPLFADETITSRDMLDELTRVRLAVVSNQSVAGFHAPLLRLATDYRITASNTSYVWFESSDEVVKAVLSGLADVGACEEPAVARVLGEAGLAARQEELLRVVLATDRIVTDPVIVPPRLSPRFSSLGREVRDAVREYSLQNGFGQLQYVQASDLEYQSLTELVREFAERVGEVRQQ